MWLKCTKNGCDLDLCYKEPISLNTLAHLEEDFEESDLPFKVDFVDFWSCSENFRKAIQPDLVPIKPQ